jgi:hypothetical protein
MKLMDVRVKTRSGFSREHHIDTYNPLLKRVNAFLDNLIRYPVSLQ